LLNILKSSISLIFIRTDETRSLFRYGDPKITLRADLTATGLAHSQYD
jgi:hypothetical protein